MYKQHIMPDSLKVYNKLAEIMEKGEYNDKKLSTYYETIYLYTLIIEGNLKAAESLFNARDREAIAEIMWLVETSLLRLRMSRESGKFSYLAAIKERRGENLELSDLNEAELILLADTMQKEAKATRLTYAMVGTIAQWALRFNILGHNLKVYSQLGTKEVESGTKLNSRITELQKAIPKGSKGRITMAVAEVEDITGNRFNLVSTSEPRGYLRPGVTLKPGEIMVTGTGHAEVDIVKYANAHNLKIINIGATRPVCTTCVGAIETTTGTIVTDIK